MASLRRHLQDNMNLQGINKARNLLMEGQSGASIIFVALILMLFSLVIMLVACLVVLRGRRQYIESFEKNLEVSGSCTESGGSDEEGSDGSVDDTIEEGVSIPMPSSLDVRRKAHRKRQRSPSSSAVNRMETIEERSIGSSSNDSSLAESIKTAVRVNKQRVSGSLTPNEIVRDGTHHV